MTMDMVHSMYTRRCNSPIHPDYVSITRPLSVSYSPHQPRRPPSPPLLIRNPKLTATAATSPRHNTLGPHLS